MATVVTVTILLLIIGFMLAFPTDPGTPRVSTRAGLGRRVMTVPASRSAGMDRGRHVAFDHGISMPNRAVIGRRLGDLPRCGYCRVRNRTAGLQVAGFTRHSAHVRQGR